VKLGVTGTPTMIIGPKRLEGLKTYEEVAAAVKAALRSS
jgi:protein-disulfide isomerase